MFSRKELARLIIPLIIEQILAVTIGMADTMMVSSVGEAAVSGISLVDTLNQLLINIFSALATGGAVVASQYMGRRDEESACQAAKQLYLTIALLSLLILALSLLFYRPVLRLIFGGIEADVMQNAQTYFVLSAISYPFLALYSAGAALFRSMGNSKVSMFTSIIMNVVNVSGNAVLIFRFGLGVTGAAVASLASRVLGAVVITALLMNHANPIHLDSLIRWEIHPKMVRNILGIGIPNGLENGMFQIGKIMVQGLIASFGTTAIAANAVANNIASMEVIPGSAIGLALITVVGQCVGAREPGQARQYTIRLMKMAYACMSVLNVFILIAAPFITQIYSLSPETAGTAVQLMWCHGLGCIIIWPLSFTFPNALRAAGDVKYTMGVSIFSMWVFRIGLSYLFAYAMGIGVLGVWIAMVVDWTFRSIMFVARFVRGKWLGHAAI